jgi:hypothetical protein
MLASPERYACERGRRHDWARQMVLHARRWMPDRQRVVVVDSSFCLARIAGGAGPPWGDLWGRGGAWIPFSTNQRRRAVPEPALPPDQREVSAEPAVLGAATTCWQRAGLGGKGIVSSSFCSAAAWRHAGLPVMPIRWVLLRDPRGGSIRRRCCAPIPAREPLQIIHWFIQRWQVEVTFRRVRDHLRVETQRQWSGRAIVRTTPCACSPLFSIVALLTAPPQPPRSPVATAV